MGLSGAPDSPPTPPDSTGRRRSMSIPAPHTVLVSTTQSAPASPPRPRPPRCPAALGDSLARHRTGHPAPAPRPPRLGGDLGSRAKGIAAARPRVQVRAGQVDLDRGDPGRLQPGGHLAELVGAGAPPPIPTPPRRPTPIRGPTPRSRRRSRGSGFRSRSSCPARRRHPWRGATRPWLEADRFRHRRPVGVEGAVAAKSTTDPTVPEAAMSGERNRWPPRATVRSTSTAPPGRELARRPVVPLQADDLDRLVTAAEALHQQPPTPDGRHAGNVVAGGGGPDQGGVPAGARSARGVDHQVDRHPISISRTGS